MEDEQHVSPRLLLLRKLAHVWFLSRFYCWCSVNGYRLPWRKNEGTGPLQMCAASTEGPTLPSPLLAIILATALSGDPASGSRVFRKADLGAPAHPPHLSSLPLQTWGQRYVLLTLPLLSVFGLFSYPLQSPSFFPITFKPSHRTHFFPLNLHSANWLACPEHPENPENLN